MGAGINVDGLTPQQAWEMVSEMNLLASKEWKRSDEDKLEISNKNKAEILKGNSFDIIKKKAANFAKNINFNGVSNLSALNEAVDTVNDLMKEYSLTRLESEMAKDLGTYAMASANAEKVNIGKRLLRNPNAAYRICVENYQKGRKEALIALKEQFAKTTDKNKRVSLQKSIDSMTENAKYARHNVIYKGAEVRSVITHEMGHVIAGQTFGFINNVGGNASMNQERKMLADCYRESFANGDIYKVSAYARKNEDEFFAECFTMYKMGKEKLPANIEKMIKGVLKK